MTLAFYIRKEQQIWSLSLYGVESDAVPLSTPPRGLENFRCVDWICSDFLLYLFSGFVGLDFGSFLYLHHVCYHCICLAFCSTFFHFQHVTIVVFVVDFHMCF